MDNKKYKNNYLSNVVFKLDFPNLSDYGIEKVKEFQRLIKGEFPIVQEEKGMMIEHKFEGTEQMKLKIEEVPLIRWKFINKTNTRTVSFESNNIGLDFKDYTSFEDYFKIVNLVVNSLFKIFPSIISTRLGLRYINNITIGESSPFDWGNLLNESLLCSLNFIPDKKDMSRHVTVVVLNKGEYTLRFQYGIANSLYPSPIIRKEFILDYDCYTFESFEKPEEVLVIVKDFNLYINDIFEISIKEGLREIMGVVKDE